MTRIFRDYPEAIGNSAGDRGRVDMSLDVSGHHLPKFPVLRGRTLPVTLRRSRGKEWTVVCDRWRISSPAKRRKHEVPAYWERLEREIEIIKSMGFPGYFLMVWDFIKLRTRQRNPCRPGPGLRGRLAGRVPMEITDVDPIRYGLLFERFLNPERVNPPDIDIDFADDRRADVIEYVRQKYGHDAVAQIITFGTMGAKVRRARRRPRDGPELRRVRPAWRR